MMQTDAPALVTATTDAAPGETYVFPTSFAQQRLWFLEQIEPQGATYNISHSYRLRGPLDLSLFERAVNRVIERHESLRTTFTSNEGTPYQVIHSRLTIPLFLVDLTNMAEADRENEALRRATAEERRPFDLEQGPLLRVNLYRLDGQLHLLLIVMHHIVSDGWSMGIFRRELAAFYAADARGALPALAELPLQYADYAVWQREWLQGPIVEQQLAYWKKQLGDAPGLELAADVPRPPILSHTGEMIQAHLSAELARDVEHLGKREGATLFMVVLAAFQLLLARITGQTDTILGSPIAGRNRREIEGLIGFFLNTLVLRTNLDGDPTFLELLARTRATVIEAFSHQDIPFEKLLESLKPTRDPSRTPFFQIFFNMHIFEGAEWSLPDIEIELVPPLWIDSNFDLTLYIGREANSLAPVLVYNTNLFTRERMQEFLNQYVFLLAQVVAHPEYQLSRYSLVTPEAQAILPDPTASLSDKWHGAIHTKFTENARRTPSQIAIRDRHEHWTYAELDRYSNQLANYLTANGITKGDIVAIYAHRGAGLVCAILGVLKAGAVKLILDPAYPASRLVSYLDIARPKGLIQIEAAGALGPELEGCLSAQGLSCRLTVPSKAKLPASQIGTYPMDAPSIVVGPDDVASISFTSGSTGQPKGVLGRHGPLTHFIPWQQQAFQLTAADRLSMLSGLSHDPLQRDIFTPLWLGATICIPDPALIGTPGALARWMAEEEITFTHLTPAMAHLVTETHPPDRSIPSLRRAFFVGEQLTHHTVQALRRLAPNVTCINSYGTTETQRAVAYLIITDEIESRPHKAVYPVGRGMPDVQLLILGSAMKDQPPLAGVGEIGEIYVRSPHLAKGYLKDEDLTRERFLTNPWTDAPADQLYRTGDLGCYLPDGSVEFLGRADRQLKLRGYRIEPSEIESILLKHPAIREAVVTLYRANTLGARLVAYLVANENPPTPRQLRAFVQARLPDFMTPSDYVYLPALPLTPNAKIDLRALPPPQAQQRSTSDEEMDETERQLVAIWQRVLQVEHIGKHDDFFELGGHSLLAARLFAQIEQEMGKKLPIAILFRAPTVADLAEVIARQDYAAANNTLVPIQPNGTRPPFFCVHGLGGGVLGYAELARVLGPDQPFYGLQARGLDGIEEPDQDIQTMAARYIKAMHTVQPKGPYHLGGYCYGGFVAFEMACQLRAQGEPVGLLAIFEGYAIRRTEARKQLWRPRALLSFFKNFPFWLRDYGSPQYQKLISRVPGRQPSRWQGLLRDADREVLLLNPHDLANSPAIPSAQRKVLAAQLHALHEYRMPVYGGPLTLFRVQALSLWRSYDPAMGWERFTTDRVDIKRIPGAHYNILEHPHVEEFGWLLSQALHDI